DPTVSLLGSTRRLGNLPSPVHYPSIASIPIFGEGAVAQLGEHLVCNQGVVGSNPIRSIRLPTPCPPPTGCRFSPSSPIALTSSRGDGFAPLDSAWRRS